ncbi:metalloendopeptidase-like membrane protein [Leptolyngbyaceae cyanobacterium JSC-12]|nr:metalloendopeptidase-like membrane protein [Leptolyngbyaceae cyanobacterium JSC-12]
MQNRLLKFITSFLLTLSLILFLNWDTLQVQAAISKTDWSYARFPIKLQDFVGYTSPFGNRAGGFHSAIDIAVDTGKPVINWWKGKVEDVVTTDQGGCGLEVYVVSGRWDHRYCHLSAVSVQKGQEVKAGDTLGLAGSTGNSSGPHLHFELRFNQSLVDPARVFRAMQKADKGVTPTAYLATSYHTRKRDENCTDCMR